MAGALALRFVLSFILVVLAVGQGDAQVSMVVGANVDSSEPPAPRCTTSPAYAVDSTLDLPTGNNGGRILRYDPVGDRVYVLNFFPGSAPGSMCVATAATPMVLIGCVPFSNPSEVFVANQPANATVNSSGEFVYYHRKVPATCTNPGFQCLGTRVWQGAAQILDVDYVGWGIQQLDGVVIDRKNDQVWLQYVDTVDSSRSLGIINGATKTIILQLFANTPSTGQNFIALDDLTVYGYTQSDAWRTPRATVNFTTAFLGCKGGRVFDNLVVARSDTAGSLNIGTSGTNPDRFCGIPKATFTQSLVTDFAAGDGDDLGDMSAFYDRGNNVIHSFRANSSTNILRRVQLSGTQDITGVILDSLAKSCCSIYIDRHTPFDFSPDNLALYYVSTTSPARITKIRVCA